MAVEIKLNWLCLASSVSRREMAELSRAGVSRCSACALSEGALRSTDVSQSRL